MKTHTFSIDQVCSKPRQTRSDVWKKRPSVVKYRSFADDIRLVARLPIHKIRPDRLLILITIGMPKSWSKKKREEMDGLPHRLKPDSDNLAKAVADALWPDEDSMVWDMHVIKRWGLADCTRVTIGETDE